MVFKKQSGFTLIELIIFIVVIGIALLSIIRALEFVSKHTAPIQDQAIASETANKCIQWYIGNRNLNGISSVPCPSTTTPAFCTAPSGFSVAVNVSCLSKYSSPSSAYRQVTVQVTGKESSTASIILADY